jgi:hypothetical protein
MLLLCVGGETPASVYRNEPGPWAVAMLLKRGAGASADWAALHFRRRAYLRKGEHLLRPEHCDYIEAVSADDLDVAIGQKPVCNQGRFHAAPSWAKTPHPDAQ